MTVEAHSPNETHQSPLNSGFLSHYLKLFEPELYNPQVQELLVNRPGSMWVEYIGEPQMARINRQGLTNDRLVRLGRLIAHHSGQSLSPENPLLTASLEDNTRVQIILPPTARSGVALSIRKHQLKKMQLRDYAFNQSNLFRDGESVKEERASNLCQKNGEAYLRYAIKMRKNILISGGTSSGKTTFLNALIDEIPHGERLITIEDTPEIAAPHANVLSLIASKGRQGRAQVTIQDLLEASLRLRPDRLLLGELRGQEAYSFLRAVNSGHPGAITTVHADTPRGALEQICLMVLQAGVQLSYETVKAYLNSIIDVVVQLKRVEGQRRITQIWCPHTE